jgi:hypothetical protein
MENSWVVFFRGVNCHVKFLDNFTPLKYTNPILSISFEMERIIFECIDLLVN